MSDPVVVTLELAPHLALALAQFAKRLCWSQIRACAVSDSEAYEIVAAVQHVQTRLAREGFAPR